MCSPAYKRDSYRSAIIPSYSWIAGTRGASHVSILSTSPLKAPPMESHDAGRAPLIVRPPLHPLLVSFPICCLGGTLLTDIAYWQTAEMMWADFSAWLIAAGVILGWIATIVGIVDLVGHRYATAP